MFYQFPPSDWMANAFAAVRVWPEQQPAAPKPLSQGEGSSEREGPPSSIDNPARTCDGFTLYTSVPQGVFSSQAMLIDMHRELVHRWAISFSRIWPNPAHLDVRPRDSGVCIFDSYLYPNGDLLVVFHAMNQVGCGLAKLNKESEALWAYGANVHHAVDVAEDGTIYALQKELVYKMPPGLERVSTPCWLDYLVTLSPDGGQLSKPISILAALKNSPYAPLLATIEVPERPHPERVGSTAPAINYAYRDEDPLHTNCVRVLRRDVASKFPNFKTGHILVSVRTLSILAILDPVTGNVEWAARGPWQAQHDPQFLENGHLLIFDNLGSPIASRVLEYDPQTQAFPWVFSGEGPSTIYSSERGMCQRLSNGNTFVLSSEDGAMLEVAPDKEIVWSCAAEGFVPCARRYAPEQVPFVSGDHHARH